MTDAATPDLLGGDSIASPPNPSPTMVDLPPPPPPENDDNGSYNNNNNITSLSTPSHSATSSKRQTPLPPPSPASGNNNPWSAVMGGMVVGGRSLVASATRGVVNSVSKREDGDGNGDGNGDGGGASATNATVTPSTKDDTATSPPSSGNGGGNAFFSALTSNITTSVSNLNSTFNQHNLHNATSIHGIHGNGIHNEQIHALSSQFSSMTKSISQSISHGITGKNTLPDKTTASQVLMFRQLLHTKCRPGLRLSRKYEGTVAQKAVLHMPWWERGIKQSKKMIISYDNLVTRLWLSGAIMPFERGGYATDGSAEEEEAGKKGAIDTLINERGLPPVPHRYWVDRLGFQQDDPVTDFRSGGVLSLAMLVHIVESCPAVHSRFVPKPKAETTPRIPSENNNHLEKEIISLEEIITDDASVLPFGITCINITDMLAKFLLFSKAIDKMDALLSAKPFWKMFIDPNAMLVLQEVSLDLLCDVCVELGRERRMKKLVGTGKEGEEANDVPSGMPGSQDGKVTVFDFSEIMERTERRVGDEVLGPGPRNVDELRAIARRVKSKYLMRIQLKEKHSSPAKNNPASLPSPLSKQIPPMPSKESMKNVTNSVIGGVGGFVSRLKKPASRGVGEGDGSGNASNEKNALEATGGQEVEVNLDGTMSAPDDTLFGFPKSPSNPFTSAAMPNTPAVAADVGDELEKLSAELGDLSAATAEAFDLLGDDFNRTDLDDVGHPEELLDAMDEKIDPFAAFAIDDDEFLS